uniref:Uncharacterized protein n=1 Tax=Anopheles coluzzii TaxID=1518534 RepID=A0A8W7Q2I5_ANOCL
MARHRMFQNPNIHEENVAKTSAPEYRSVCSATSSSRTSSAKGTLVAIFRNISNRPFPSGAGTWISLVSRPGRSKASSTISGRLVAAITTTRFASSLSALAACSACPIPSISISSVDRTPILTAPEPPFIPPVPRLPTSESISSKNTTAGAFVRASLNTRVISFSASPT